METWLPLLNTTLIVISGIALLFGYIFIRRKNIEYHRRAMLTATVFAGLFLVVYVTRFFVLDTKLFTGEGWAKAVYYVILFSHMVLATVIAPLVLLTIYRALRGQYRRHRRIARVTLPMWLYVVVTGWLVYLMLYQFTFTQT